MGDIGEAGNFVFALLDNNEGEDREVSVDDATTDGLALALAGPARSVAGVAVGKEKADTGGVHDTLLHGETLLVVASGDLEDVSLELISNAVTRDLLSHTLLHENTETTLIIDINELLGAIGWVAVIGSQSES